MWITYRYGWWEFDLDTYHAGLSATMRITPDGKNPTASGSTLKSGYGIQETVTARVSTSQSSATTPAQNAVTYFPEFQYGRFWRLLGRTGSGYQARFEFQENVQAQHSIINSVRVGACQSNRSQNAGH